MGGDFDITICNFFYSKAYFGSRIVIRNTKKELDMKKSLIIGAIFAALFAGCAQSTTATAVYHDAQGAVCAQLDDGSKQTFPSMQELAGYSGASYLHDGPCYE